MLDTAAINQPFISIAQALSITFHFHDTCGVSFYGVSEMILLPHLPALQGVWVRLRNREISRPVLVLHGPALGGSR
jgi:hypothetical protein